MAREAVLHCGPAPSSRSKGLFTDVRIVDFARCDDDNKRVKDAYQSLFPDLPDANFDFAGASAWIERQPGYASIP